MARHPQHSPRLVDETAGFGTPKCHDRQAGKGNLDDAGLGLTAALRKQDQQGPQVDQAGIKANGSKLASNKVRMSGRDVVKGQLQHHEPAGSVGCVGIFASVSGFGMAEDLLDGGGVVGHAGLGHHLIASHQVDVVAPFALRSAP